MQSCETLGIKVDFEQRDFVVMKVHCTVETVKHFVKGDILNEAISF